jgi:hypothetical protein
MYVLYALISIKPCHLFHALPINNPDIGEVAPNKDKRQTPMFYYNSLCLRSTVDKLRPSVKGTD